MPRAQNMVAATSSGLTASAAGKAPMRSLAPWIAPGTMPPPARQDRITSGPVPATVRAELLGIFDLRRSAELAHPHDQRLFQKPARLHIFDQCGDGQIGIRQQPIPELVEIVAVRVPAVALAADKLRVVDRYKPHARLDQTPGQQTALAVGVSAVSVAELGCFLRKIERPLHLG